MHASLTCTANFVDSPETASFLTQTERDFIVRRLADETGSGQGRVTNQDKMGKKFIIAGLSDWKIWAAVVIFWGNTVGVYGYVFLPIKPRQDSMTDHQ